MCKLGEDRGVLGVRVIVRELALELGELDLAQLASLDFGDPKDLLGGEFR